MFPVLFRIPLPWGEDNYFPIRMFGVMVILGFLAGTWVVARRLKRLGLMEPQDTFDFCFYLLAVGIGGSRLLYIVQNFGEFRGRFLKVFAIWEGGLVWYGGMVAATLFAFWWLWKKKLPVLKVADAAAIGMALGLAIGRWGCFCAGDDYGAKILAEDGSPIVSAEHAPWYAVQFPRSDGTEATWRYTYGETPSDFRAPHWLHPVQLYMSLGNLIVFAGLLLVERRAKRPGVVSAWLLFLYPVNRFVVEFWRGDADRGLDVWGTGLSFSQMFGIPVVLLGFAVLRAATSAPPGAPADRPPPRA